jgi:hypothetical protein
VEQPVKPYDVEDDITLQRVEPEPEPVFAPAPEDTVVEAQPNRNSQWWKQHPSRKKYRQKRRPETPCQSWNQTQDSTPRKSAGSATKRTKKKTAPPTDEGSLQF